MNQPLFRTRLSTILFATALAAAISITAHPLADDAKPPIQDRLKAQLNRQAIQQEIANQPEGIHKISDGSICIKCGHGLATVHADGRGCGTGPVAIAPRAVADEDLMTGIFKGLFMDPKEGEQMGIGPDLAEKIKNAYGYMDHMGTHPGPVLKLYEQYAKAPEGKPKADAEKALMDKVRAVGQAYVDSEVKKLKDVKALLTPDQTRQLRVIGGKMLRPFEKPIA